MAIVRRFANEDTEKVAAIHAESFPRQGLSEQWIRCNSQAYPRMRYFVIEHETRIRGFILWMEKSGFRQQVVLELEQIAVSGPFRRKGFAEALIRESLADVVSQLAERGAQLSSVIVTTRSDNEAQRLYRKALGAEIVAVVPSLFGADEVVMVAREPLRSNTAFEADRTGSKAARSNAARRAT